MRSIIIDVSIAVTITYWSKAWFSRSLFCWNNFFYLVKQIRKIFFSLDNFFCCNCLSVTLSVYLLQIVRSTEWWNFWRRFLNFSLASFLWSFLFSYTDSAHNSLGLTLFLSQINLLYWQVTKFFHKLFFRVHMMWLICKSFLNLIKLIFLNLNLIFDPSNSTMFWA